MPVTEFSAQNNLLTFGRGVLHLGVKFTCRVNFDIQDFGINKGLDLL